MNNVNACILFSVEWQAIVSWSGTSPFIPSRKATCTIILDNNVCIPRMHAMLALFDIDCGNIRLYIRPYVPAR